MQKRSRRSTLDTIITTGEDESIQTTDIVKGNSVKTFGTISEEGSTTGSMITVLDYNDHSNTNHDNVEEEKETQKKNNMSSHGHDGADDTDDDDGKKKMTIDTNDNTNGKGKVGNNNNTMVRFSTVHVREYNVCLGDNPSVAQGAPISLDWHYTKEVSYELDEYETRFSSSSSSSSSSYSSNSNSYNSNQESGSVEIAYLSIPLSSQCNMVNSCYHDHDQHYHYQHTIQHQLKRPSLERKHLLQRLGYSRKDIQKATKKGAIIRNQRSQTRRRVEMMDNLRSYFFFFFHSSNRSRKSSNHWSSIFGCCHCGCFTSNTSYVAASSLSATIDTSIGTTTTTTTTTSSSTEHPTASSTRSLIHCDSLTLAK